MDGHGSSNVYTSDQVHSKRLAGMAAEKRGSQGPCACPPGGSTDASALERGVARHGRGEFELTRPSGMKAAFPHLACWPEPCSGNQTAAKFARLAGTMNRSGQESSTVHPCHCRSEIGRSSPVSLICGRDSLGFGTRASSNLEGVGQRPDTRLWAFRQVLATVT